MDDERARAHIIIKGHVQGVFFRANIREKARELGLTGWVGNHPSGTVEAVFEGDKRSIEKIIEYCEMGPPAAEVEDLDIEWRPFQREFNTFYIRY